MTVVHNFIKDNSQRHKITNMAKMQLQKHFQPMSVTASTLDTTDTDHVLHQISSSLIIVFLCHEVNRNLIPRAVTIPPPKLKMKTPHNGIRSKPSTTTKHMQCQQKHKINTAQMH